MICPKCSADTKVKDSRPEAEGRMIRRRRECEGCGHKFNTYESTLNVVSRWAADRQAAVSRYHRWAEKTSPEERAARWKRKRLRASARVEAQQTGRDVEEILRDWGLPAANARPASPNP